MEEKNESVKSKKIWIITLISILIICLLIQYIQPLREGLNKFFRILEPFALGLLLAYILVIPCRKIEKFLKKSKLFRKRARGFSVFLTYFLFILFLVALISWITPILRKSIEDIVNNIPYYYDLVTESYEKLPDDSPLKAQGVQDKINEIQNFDVQKFVEENKGQLMEYAKNLVGVAKGIYNICIAFVVSIYILVRRKSLVNGLRKLSRAIFNKKTFENVDKYFIAGNEIFYTFITSQLIDAFIVGAMTTIGMLILQVQYAPLLGFIIGLCNLIPYIGAIIGVLIALLITFMTGGFWKMVEMGITVIILQQIDANIINPKLLGNRLKTNPLLVLFAISIGGAYFGPLGMFISVPIAVVIKTIISDFSDSRNKLKDEEDKIQKI